MTAPPTHGAGPVAVVYGAGPEPADLDARVYEQDADLLMDTSRPVRDPGQGYRALIRAMTLAPRREPGTVLVVPGCPLRVLALVYDFDRQPVCRPEWVYSALVAALEACEERHLPRIGLPRLGTRHGIISAAEFDRLLAGALDWVSPRHLQEVWVLPYGPEGSEADDPPAG